MMKFLTAAILILIFATPVKSAMIDVPPAFREENWLSGNNEGSCGWASTVIALRAVGQHILAEQYRRDRSGGTWSTKLISAAQHYQVRFDYTTTGDRSWMEWALRNRLVVICNYYPSHVICVVGKVNEHMVILDNNHTSYYRTVPVEVFYRNWKQRYSGFGMAFLYYPLPPWPK